MATIICPICGIAINEPIKTCPVCGAPIDCWQEEKTDIYVYTDDLINKSTGYKVFRIIKTILSVPAIFCFVILGIAILISQIMSYGEYASNLATAIIFIGISVAATILFAIPLYSYTFSLAEHIIILCCVRRSKYDFLKSVARTVRPERFEGEIEYRTMKRVRYALYTRSAATLIASLFKSLVFFVDVVEQITVEIIICNILLATQIKCKISEKSKMMKALQNNGKHICLYPINLRH